MTAPYGPVAPAKVRGSEKMPAPTIPPTTIAVSCIRDIFCSVEAMPIPPDSYSYCNVGLTAYPGEAGPAILALGARRTGDCHLPDNDPFRAYSFDNV